MEGNTLKPSLADWFKPFPFKLGQLLLGYRGSEVTLVVTGLFIKKSTHLVREKKNVSNKETNKLDKNLAPFFHCCALEI